MRSPEIVRAVHDAVHDAVGAAVKRGSDVSAHDGPAQIVLAVSGGADSIVLLHAMASVVDRKRLIVATFDHGTGEFARNAVDFVRGVAAQLGVRFVSAHAASELSGEAAFRAARWVFLHGAAEPEGALIATAHTRSDQVETVLMRVLRGAGARGLAGLYAESAIVRPLLAFTRAQIVAYARARDINWLDDPSNASTMYLRNRIRRELLPALRVAAPAIERELLRLAKSAAVWRRDVDDVVDSLVDATVHVESIRRRRGLDVDASKFAELSRGDAATLWPALLIKRGIVLDRRGTARLAAFSIAARVGARIQLRGGWQVIRSRDALQLRASDEVGAASEATLTPLALSNSTKWGQAAAGDSDGDWSFRAIDTTSPEAAVVGKDAWSAWLPSDRALSVRSWQAGDRLVAVGKSPRKVKGLLSAAGVTGHQRMRWPVVLADDQIVWIPGVRQPRANGTRSPQSGLPFVCDHFDSQRDR